MEQGYILKIERARKPAQRGPEDLDLLFPCLPLIDFEAVGVAVANAPRT